MASDTKKRKITEENRKFNILWTEEYFIIETCNKIICLICNDEIAVCNLALDKSTDQSDTAQLIIFIGGIEVNFNIIEEMLDVCHMKGTTTGRDIIEHVNLSLEKFHVDRNKINSITTDGAPALTEMFDHDILSYHCLIHQQQLCAQKLNMKYLMTDIVSVVHFIRSQCLNHRTLKAYLVEVGTRRLLFMWGSTYCCEQFFSCMKNIKTAERNRLSDCHLTITFLE
uniref:DUF4371 domain-containing protein n=1 Tax=Octopus bimaculoides TaxID=37653 RepID=A0A0L8IFV7_OCTBM